AKPRDRDLPRPVGEPDDAERKQSRYDQKDNDADHAENPVMGPPCRAYRSRYRQDRALPRARRSAPVPSSSTLPRGHAPQRATPQARTLLPQDRLAAP